MKNTGHLCVDYRNSFFNLHYSLSKNGPRVFLENPHGGSFYPLAGESHTSSFTVPNSGSRALKWYLKLPSLSTAALKSLSVTSPSLPTRHNFRGQVRLRARSAGPKAGVSSPLGDVDHEWCKRAVSEVQYFGAG